MLRRTKAADGSAVLRGVPLFSACSDGELAKLDALALESSVSAGQVLCTEGSIGREFIVLLEGEAKVESSLGVDKVVGAGDFFGELALLDDEPRSASVTMLTDGRALVLSGQEFRQLLKEVPRIAVGMLPVLAARVRSAEGARG